jgi:hypothetical protein
MALRLSVFAQSALFVSTASVGLSPTTRSLEFGAVFQPESAPEYEQKCVVNNLQYLVRSVVVPGMAMCGAVPMQRLHDSLCAEILRKQLGSIYPHPSLGWRDRPPSEVCRPLAL